MDQIISALKGTPWWVYVLLVYLVIIGLKARQSHVVSLKKIFILPAIILIWSLFSMFSQLTGFTDLFFWVIFLFAGCVFGFRLVKGKPIRADRKKYLIKVPGTNLILILALAIFATKYFFGYYYATHTNIPVWINFLRLGASGLICGMLIGRVYYYLKKFAAAHHEKLKVKK